MFKMFFWKFCFVSLVVGWVGSGSVKSRYRSKVPDPLKNLTEPGHCFPPFLDTPILIPLANFVSFFCVRLFYSFNWSFPFICPVSYSFWSLNCVPFSYFPLRYIAESPPPVWGFQYSRICTYFKVLIYSIFVLFLFQIPIW
jgi:hypothetical protein